MRGMINLSMLSYMSSISHIRSGEFEWIQHNAHKNLKTSKTKKGKLKFFLTVTARQIYVLIDLQSYHSLFTAFTEK
jgi:hypothetical protein